MHIKIEHQKHVFGAMLIAVGQQMIQHNKTAYDVLGGAEHASMSPHKPELIASMVENGCSRQEAEEVLNYNVNSLFD